MAETSKKQNFLHGAALLAIATAVVKLIGAFYKLPLNEVIGPEGYAYFTTAYDIYSVLLLIATAGLPVAMSRMISQASALGQNNQVRRIYNTSRILFLSIGLASTLFMLLGSKWLSGLLNQPNAWVAIACLAPCALFMGMISTYRGFFQGQGNMRPTSNSQMLEAACKLIVGLAAAFTIMYLTGNVAYAAGGAILGVTASCLVSVIYLRAKLKPDYERLDAGTDQCLGYKQTTKQLLAIAVPITIGSAGLQLLTVLETGVYMDRLVGIIDSGSYMQNMLREGLDSQRSATVLKGIYDMAKTIYNMPCAFIIPITVSVIPAITANLTLGKNQDVRETEESAARITGLLSMPCAVGLSVLAVPVMSLLAGHTGQRLVLGGQLMSIMGINVFFYATYQYTTALMQAHGLAHVPVIHMLVCGVGRLAVVFILAGNPYLGILAVPIGTLVCYFSITVLNLIAVRRFVPQKPALIRNLLRPLLPALIMGVAAYGTYWGLSRFFNAGSRMGALVLCGGAIGVGAVVYLVCVVVLKAITKADCMLLPKGEKIAKLLHL